MIFICEAARRNCRAALLKYLLTLFFDAHCAAHHFRIGKARLAVVIAVWENGEEGGVDVRNLAGVAHELVSAEVYFYVYVLVDIAFYLFFYARNIFYYFYHTLIIDVKKIFKRALYQIFTFGFSVW